ncbi:MAG: hypothetical protein JXA30_00800 [Deltaproteobacteria bacterium]|nr:hypothetical protein [Deltaproteobacteria bacterium]
MNIYRLSVCLFLALFALPINAFAQKMGIIRSKEKPAETNAPPLENGSVTETTSISEGLVIGSPNEETTATRVRTASGTERTTVEAHDLAIGEEILRKYYNQASSSVLIPEVYVGIWVYHDDKGGTQFLVISPTLIVWRTNNGIDRVVGRGKWQILRNELQFTYTRPRPFSVSSVSDERNKTQSSGYEVAPNIGNFWCDDGKACKSVDEDSPEIFLPKFANVKGKDFPAWTAWADLKKVGAGRSLPTVSLQATARLERDSLHLVVTKKREPFRCRFSAIVGSGPSPFGSGTCIITVGGEDLIFTRPDK